MTRKLFFTLLFIGLLPAVRLAAQGGDASARVKAQAQKMASALVKADYATFCHYMNPAVLKMVGGEAAMTKQVSTMIESMKKQGMSFGNVSIGEPSKLLASGKELQCTIPQESEVKVQDKKVVSKSTLIAISADGGKSWTFLDTNNKDLAAVRKLLPNLSPAISFPPSQQIRE